MSAIITNIEQLDLTKTYSYSDYLLWQFQERVELIKGFVIKMNPIKVAWGFLPQENPILVNMVCL